MTILKPSVHTVLGIKGAWFAVHAQWSARPLNVTFPYCWILVADALLSGWKEFPG